MNRWGPVDTVWRSTDGGTTWADIVGKSERDVSATPFLLWGNKEAKLGWWMAAFAIDPFNSDHAAYATGATIFATHDFSNVNHEQTTHWQPWVEGIEQTAIITLLSPASGPHLISGFGDIGGFAHTDLDKSPPQGMFQTPQFGNTNTLDYAGLQPNVIVRSGTAGEGQATLAYSEDSGHTWQPLLLPAGNQDSARRDTPAVITSADGKSFIVMTNPPQLTRDRGKTWIPIQGLPQRGRPVADRVNPSVFYALDFSNGTMLTSTDGGATFTSSATTGLPADISRDQPTWREAAWPLHATPDQQENLWFVSREGLFHSSDGGKTFSKSTSDVLPYALSFGKAPQGKDYPALFALGRRGDLNAIWRSDDRGASWIRVNDDQHQWGTRFRCIAGDPRIFGRVYVGTDGRGILYGEPITNAG
jgi:photosystem II stability/assembly factor-like uncharacterized protein